MIKITNKIIEYDVRKNIPSDVATTHKFLPIHTDQKTYTIKYLSGQLKII